MLPALVLQLLSLLPVAATCLTQNGDTACGYNCLAAHGQVACARTSAGICSASTTEVLCWDPPESVRAHYGEKIPRPECLTRSGNIACGYHCEAHDDEVRCAQTP